MEHFKGSLASYRLQLLVPALCGGGGASGVLRLERGALVRRFLLRGGLLVEASSSEPREHLAQVLVNRRVLSADRAAAVFEAAEMAGRPFAHYLLEKRLVEEAPLRQALEDKARSALFHCYTWESGEVEFVPGRWSGARALELGLALSGLHREALEEVRAWQAFQAEFPDRAATLEVHRAYGADLTSEEEDDALVDLAEAGASVDEVLAASPEGPLRAARRLRRLVQAGVLGVAAQQGPRLGEDAGPAELLALARRSLSEGRFEVAAEAAAQLLERTPAPEAQPLYRTAEERLARDLARELHGLEGRLHAQPLLRPAPAHLTADDLYLYSKLRGGKSLRQAQRSAGMGELGAARALRRLMAAGLVRVSGEGPGAAGSVRRTDPYGLPAVS